jgi:hypothetical protein
MKVTIPETVMVNELGREGVLLDLANGEYFSLDEVGMDMWKALGRCGSTEGACAELLPCYAIDDMTLQRDLDHFAQALAARRLLLVETGHGAPG